MNKRSLILAAIVSASIAHATEYNVTSDDIDDFTNKVANAQSGDKFILAAGEYKIPETLRLLDLSSVTLSGAGAESTVICPVASCRLVLVSNCTDIVFSGIAFRKGAGKTETVALGTANVGGGACLMKSSRISFQNCAFLTNSVTYGQPFVYNCGGALYAENSTFSTVGCLFEGNKATHKSSNWATRGACLGLYASTYSSTNDVFRGNVAPYMTSGGASQIDEGVVCCMADKTASARFVNALVHGNAGEITSGGTLNAKSLFYGNIDSPMALENCTIAGNFAQRSVYAGAITVTNSILRGATVADVDKSTDGRCSAKLYNSIYGKATVTSSTHCSAENPSLTEDLYLSPSSYAVDYCGGDVAGTIFAERYSAAGDAKDTGAIDCGYHHAVPGKVSKTSLAGGVFEPIPDQALFDAPRTPDPVVTLDGKPLTKGTDYTVTYAGNDRVGTATLTISGIGLYEGTASTTFTVFAAYENTTVDVGSFAALKKAIADSRSNCVFRLAAGRHEMSETLVLDGKDGLTVVGSSEGETALVKAGGRLLFVRNARGATFRNLTLQGGTGVADAPELGNGSTIACVGSAAKLVNATDVVFDSCAFRTNSISGSAASFASNGGTVAAQDSGVRFAGCLFEGNSVVCGNSGNWHAHGAGLLLYGSSSAVMTNVVFRGNYYGNSSVGASVRDGLFCWANTGSSAKLVNCIAEGNGGEADFSGMSTCLFEGGNVQLENCTLASNGVRQAVCASSLTLTNSIVVGSSEFDLVKSSKLSMYDSFYGTLSGSPDVSEGCSTEDPLLTADCFLQHGSPAINFCESKVAGTPYAALWAEKRFRPDTGLLDCGFHHLACPVPAPGLMLMVR